MGAFTSRWTVAVLALLIGVMTLVRWPANRMQMGIAIVFLLLIGFLFPPLGVGIGTIALLYLFVVQGWSKTLIDRFSSAITQPKPKG